MGHLRGTFVWRTRAAGSNRRMDNAIDRQTACRHETATSFQRRHRAFALLYCRSCRRVGAREELVASRGLRQEHSRAGSTNPKRIEVMTQRRRSDEKSKKQTWFGRRNDDLVSFGWT